MAGGYAHQPQGNAGLAAELRRLQKQIDDLRRAMGGAGVGAPGPPGADGAPGADGPAADLSGLVPIADPTGATITTVDNGATGEGTINVLTFPTDTVAMAFKIAGDEFPRWMFTSDGHDGIYIGDGTYDPLITGANIWLQSGDLVIGGAPADSGAVKVNCDLNVQGALAVADDITANGVLLGAGTISVTGIDMHLSAVGDIRVNTDAVFLNSTTGPVLADRSDGHTYRLVCTAGVFSSELVT
jgi:hypothetical protein